MVSVKWQLFIYQIKGHCLWVYLSSWYSLNMSTCFISTLFGHLLIIIKPLKELTIKGSSQSYHCITQHCLQIFSMASSYKYNNTYIPINKIYVPYFQDIFSYYYFKAIFLQDIINFTMQILQSLNTSENFSELLDLFISY